MGKRTQTPEGQTDGQTDEHADRKTDGQPFPAYNPSYNTDTNMGSKHLDSFPIIAHLNHLESLPITGCHLHHSLLRALTSPMWIG